MDNQSTGKLIFINFQTFFKIYRKNRFTAIKLPNLKSNLSDGTIYVYMDAKNPEWTYATGITTEESAVGHTVAQMYATDQSYNKVIFIRTGE